MSDLSFPILAGLTRVEDNWRDLNLFSNTRTCRPESNNVMAFTTSTNPNKDFIFNMAVAISTSPRPQAVAKALALASAIKNNDNNQL